MNNSATCAALLFLSFCLAAGAEIHTIYPDHHSRVFSTTT
jgi:hypothetical protein